jgi:ubiquinone/menaquinone biosynthesis C-methylase UbiE
VQPTESRRRYLPAAGRDLFLPAYDPLMRLLRFSRDLDRLIAQAALQPSHRVLDVGCGTGTLAILIKRRFPSVDVHAVDPDPKALARAARKSVRARAEVRFDRAFGDAIPLTGGAFDRVFSTMMFHHVPRDEKPRVLAEIRRVLKPGGRLELVDFAGGGPPNLLARLIHGSSLAAAGDDRLVRRMLEAGFVEARREGDRQTILGAIGFYQAIVRQ